ncbi:hypothetical protein CFI11_20110 [Thalassococcus sp. S3]|nr:hypothetical protein CFI11_20110 [Thalassococcus sp. S3]
MCYEEKYQRAFDLMEQAGVSRKQREPWMTRLARRWGVQLRPPLFQSFWVIFAVQGIAFGVSWGLIMWLLQWGSQNISPMIAVIATLSAGLLFGFLMALFMQRSKRRHNLPDWEAV